MQQLVVRTWCCCSAAACAQQNALPNRVHKTGYLQQHYNSRLCGAGLSLPCNICDEHLFFIYISYQPFYTQLVFAHSLFCARSSEPTQNEDTLGLCGIAGMRRACFSLKPPGRRKLNIYRCGVHTPSLSAYLRMTGCIDGTTFVNLAGVFTVVGVAVVSHWSLMSLGSMRLFRRGNRRKI